MSGASWRSGCRAPHRAADHVTAQLETPAQPPAEIGRRIQMARRPNALRTRPCVSRCLLRHVLDPQDLDGARGVDHPIEGDVVGVQHEFANAGRQPGPALMAE